jgi:hypothetical protein
VLQPGPYKRLFGKCLEDKTTAVVRLILEYFQHLQGDFDIFAFRICELTVIYIGEATIFDGMFGQQDNSINREFLWKGLQKVGQNVDKATGQLFKKFLVL